MKEITGNLWDYYGNQCSVPREYLCPKCKQPLQEIRYPSDSMLNRDQWESQLPGDLFCTHHNNHKGNKPYAYFWKSSLAESPSESAPDVVVDANKEMEKEGKPSESAPGTMPSCHVCGTIMTGVCPKCSTTTKAESAPVPKGGDERCSCDVPHPAHTYGGHPMILCKGIPKPDCDGSVVRSTGQCNSCLAYHMAHPTSESGMDEFDERAMMELGALAGIDGRNRYTLRDIADALKLKFKAESGRVEEPRKVTPQDAIAWLETQSDSRRAIRDADEDVLAEFANFMASHSQPSVKEKL